MIVVSALTDAGAALTTQALRLGAFDFILKPQRRQFRRESRPDCPPTCCPRSVCWPSGGTLALESATHRPKCDLVIPAKLTGRAPRQLPEIVAIGISTGGPAALHTMLPGLPADLPVPS